MDDNADTPISDDDWGAAIAEQEKAEAAASQKSEPTVSAAIFNDFSAKSSPTETHNITDCP